MPIRLPGPIVASMPGDTRSSLARVLIAGGGVAALEVALALRRLVGDRLKVELMSPEPAFRYRPLSVAEPFGLGAAEAIDLKSFAADHGFGFRLGALASVDPGRSEVRTGAGDALPYDALVVALGARAEPALPGALAFRGREDVGAMRELLADLDRGAVRRIAFVLRPRASWPVPLYELALMTAARLRARGGPGEITLVTHEGAPLDLFGPRASEAVATMLEEAGVVVVTRRYATGFEDGVLRWTQSGALAVDRVVALPQLEGPRVAGLPHDVEGFLPTDLYGRVRGVPDVYAAGDATAFPVKQGGLAAEQADAVAESIAAWAGAALTPAPFRPVLRGKILTGGAPLYVRSDPAGGRGDVSDVSPRPLWWPPTKVAGRFLAPALAGAGVEPAPSLFQGIAPLAVQVDLEEMVTPTGEAESPRIEREATSPATKPGGSET